MPAEGFTTPDKKRKLPSDEDASPFRNVRARSSSAIDSRNGTVTTSTREMLEYKLQVLAHIPTDIYLFDSTAQDIARLCSYGDCGLDFQHYDFLDTLLGLLEKNGADETRLQAAKPIFEAIQDGMLLERVANRLRSVKELKSAMFTIMNTARETVPELRNGPQDPEADFDSLVCCLLSTNQDSTPDARNDKLPTLAKATPNGEHMKRINEEAQDCGSRSLASEKSTTKENLYDMVPSKSGKEELPTQSMQSSSKPSLKPELGRPGVRRSNLMQRVTSSASAPSNLDQLKSNTANSNASKRLSAPSKSLENTTDNIGADDKSKGQKHLTDLLTEATEQTSSTLGDQAKTNASTFNNSSSEDSVLGKNSSLRGTPQDISIGNAGREPSNTEKDDGGDKQIAISSQAEQSKIENARNGKESPNAEKRASEYEKGAFGRHDEQCKVTNRDTGSVPGNGMNIPQAQSAKFSVQSKAADGPDHNIQEGKQSPGQKYQPVRKDIINEHEPSSPSKQGARHSPSTLAGLKEMIAEEARRSKPQETRILGLASHTPTKEQTRPARVKHEVEEPPVPSMSSLAKLSSLPPRAPSTVGPKSWIRRSEQMCYFWFYGDACTKRASECKFRHDPTDWVASRGGGPPKYVGEAAGHLEDRMSYSADTPIIDRLWGMEPLDTANRDRFVDTVIRNIQSRARSPREFETECVDSRGRSLKLSIADSGMRSQLMSFFGTVNVSELRPQLESRLGVFVAYNPDKFLDLEPWMYEGYAYKTGPDNGYPSYGEPSGKYGRYNYEQWRPTRR